MDLNSCTPTFYVPGVGTSTTRDGTSPWLRLAGRYTLCVPEPSIHEAMPMGRRGRGAPMAGRESRGRKCGGTARHGRGMIPTRRTQGLRVGWNDGSRVARILRLAREQQKMAVRAEQCVVTGKKCLCRRLSVNPEAYVPILVKSIS